MREYYIYNLRTSKMYVFKTHQKRYSVLHKLIQHGYCVEAFYNGDNIKQYIVNKFHE